MQLSTATIRYEEKDWRKSTVKGEVEITLVGRLEHLLREHNDWRITESILLSYEDVNTLHDELSNLDQLDDTPTG